jgi:CDGSH-type Zn-finger protein
MYSNYSGGKMSKAKMAQNGPYVMEMEPGKYAWCACGLSENQPFCDGSHKQVTDFKSIVEEIKEKRIVAWCGCKQSAKKPYCDGTHTKF